MYEVEMQSVYGKSHKYKLCVKCNRLHWYETEECLDGCGKTFIEDDTAVIKYIDEEYREYESMGYLEEEIDHILIEV